MATGDLAPESAPHAASEEALTHPDATALKPLIRGDWVLFHPVYSEDELHAVHQSADVSKACVTNASHRAGHPSRHFPTDADQERRTGSSVDHQFRELVSADHHLRHTLLL